MKFSQLLCPTLKEDPSEAETISHKLMLRAGMIRQVAAGIYDLLPVGLRVTRRVENIVREEMNRAGAQEVYLPAIQPAELWKESGRWELLGKEMLRLKDRNDRDYCFGPTHEEVITDLVRREVKSYRDLPKNLYQIQVKFRDEVRPRFGLMRGREFIMKDAYSFDSDSQGADQSYEAMDGAYRKIFSRCGLDFRAVEADSGNIGGSRSQEFMVLAPSGEDEVIHCSKCDYAANVEKAGGRKKETKVSPLSRTVERKKTPGKSSVGDIAALFAVEASQVLKTLIVDTDKGFVAVVLAGDRELSEIKLTRFLGAKHVRLASSADVLKLTQAPVGFVGPMGFGKISPERISRWVVDNSIESDQAYVAGANVDGEHLIGVVAGRDFPLTDPGDFHRTSAGDLCLSCGAPLLSVRGIEVGHIFKLGTKYSEAMGATFTDKEGALRPAIMGCYGIGIGRTAAAAIEQNHDERGIVFPPALAPFDVSVVTTESQKPVLLKESDRVYRELLDAGWEVLLDDRDESAGKKFKDADLLGIPIRVTVGEKGMSQGKLEVKKRKEAKGEFLDPSQLTTWVRQALR